MNSMNMSSVSSSYLQEVMPVVLRGYLTTYVNLCWATGQFISAGVLQGLVTRTDQWAYRIPFAIQWVWPPIIFAGLAFMPESPWHYVRKGDLGRAEKSLNRLKSADATGTTKAQLATMVSTNKLELELSAGTSYLDCFRGVDLRRTEIVCITFVCQVLSGSAFAYNATYFFTQAGLSTDAAYKMNLGDTAIAFCGTIFSWFLISKFGRRSLFVSGLAVLTIVLALIGVCSAASASVGSKWAQSSLSIAWLGIYSSTVGPVCYAIIAETSSTRLRAKSVALARNSYSVVNILANTAEPYLINPSELGLKGRTGFVWMATCFIALVWAFFRLPECKGRTYEELDILFVKKVSARNFSTTNVDVYNGDADDVLQSSKVESH